MKIQAVNPQGQEGLNREGVRAIYCPWMEIEDRMQLEHTKAGYRELHEDIARRIINKDSRLSNLYNKLKDLFEEKYDKDPNNKRAMQFFLMMYGAVLYDFPSEYDLNNFEGKFSIVFCGKSIENQKFLEKLKNADKNITYVNDILDGIDETDDTWGLLSKVLIGREEIRNNKQSPSDDHDYR